MAAHDREGRDTEDTCKLLCSDANQRDGVLGLDCLTPRPDHCDLLLDAIDKQLDQLQIKSPRPKRGAVLKAQNARNTEKTLSSWDVSVNHTETKKSLDVILRGKDEPESRMDQVIWRLERLLGEACKEGKIAGEAQPPSDSICTEDFVRCFKEEMVNLSPKTERTEISDGGSHQSDQNRQSPESRGSETCDTVMTHSFHSNQSSPVKEERTCLFGSCGENMSQDKEKAGAGERNMTPQRPGDCSSAWRFDSVSADSDPDTDGTERVRQQARWTGRCSFTEDVGDLTDSCVDHSDNDTAAEEETEVQSAAA
ncbi:uncharacterized protein LOC118564766 [Fundulus heteroclitus]|uniref:uncharacterized protein LOC118564766 n=1 Tax=Fundulus heteroclitus TaxID=8078 RepID=UPI00165B17A6|nr:uncharacterized protein LOC118564766 [Fundulus heteroclitus]